MDQNNVITAFFVLELPYGFQKGLAFDIADGSADFYNGDLSVFGSRIAVKSAFDLVGDVRNNLYRSTAKIATAFFL